MQQLCISKDFNSYHIYKNGVGMSATVGGNVCNSGGNVCNSGEIEYALKDLRLEIVIHNFAWITFEDTWNNMSKAY